MTYGTLIFLAVIGIVVYMMMKGGGGCCGGHDHHKDRDEHTGHIKKLDDEDKGSSHDSCCKV